MKTPTIDSKRRAAGEREEDKSTAGPLTVGLIAEEDVPTVARATGKRSALLDSPEWRQANELLAKGLPDRKVLQIPLSAETLASGKTPKHSAIAFKRHLMNHFKRMNWKFGVSLKGETLFVNNETKKK